MLIRHLRQDFAFSLAYLISELTTHDYMIDLLGTVIGPFNSPMTINHVSTRSSDGDTCPL